MFRKVVDCSSGSMTSLATDPLTTEGWLALHCKLYSIRHEFPSIEWALSRIRQSLVTANIRVPLLLFLSTWPCWSLLRSTGIIGKTIDCFSQLTALAVYTAPSGPMRASS